MLSKEDIISKAEDILDRKEYEAKCIKAGICPDCGVTLTDVGGEDYIQMGCTKCGEEYESKKYIWFGQIVTKRKVKIWE